MLARHKRKVTAVPVAPRRFAEDYDCDADCVTASPHSSAACTPFCSPSRRRGLRAEELEFTTIARQRRPPQSAGSVFHLAKRWEERRDSSGTTESSLASEGVEVIVSELETTTVVSCDVSDSSTVKDNSSAESSDECYDFRAGMRSVLESSRRLSQQRTSERKSLFAKVRSQMEPNCARARLRRAVFALVADLTVRQEFLRALDVTPSEDVFLMRSGGRVLGLYTLEQRVFRKLFALEASDSAISEDRRKRWLRLDDDQLVPLCDSSEAVAFDC